MKLFLFLFILLQIFVSPAFAVSDPRLKPNNIVGINSLSPEAEISDAASLVNTGGDWGYIVIIIKKDERDAKRWQAFLDAARKNHLIPIIRLATVFDKNGYWTRPDMHDANDWANFLSKLYFPTKNRYVEVYNEVNASGEWGGSVDAADYAKELEKTINALKAKSSDFFILNAPLDSSLPTSKDSLDAGEYFQKMQEAVPGIFNKIDGWASHSYPNPAFSAPPTDSGRTSIDGFAWELEQIGKYTGKDLPVFITETGWKRTEKLSEEQIASYYKEAFKNVWNDKRIVAVAPFLLSYPEPLFNQFAFVNASDPTNKTYYSYFSQLAYMPKVKGEPERENLIWGLKINKPNVILKGFGSKVRFEFKNVGNFVWDTKKDLSIKVISANISIDQTLWSKEEIYPGEDVSASIKIKGNAEGTVPLKLEIVDGDQVLATSESTLTVETPWSLFVKKLKTILPKR